MQPDAKHSITGQNTYTTLHGSHYLSNEQWVAIFRFRCANICNCIHDDSLGIHGKYISLWQAFTSDLDICNLVTTIKKSFQKSSMFLQYVYTL